MQTDGRAYLGFRNFLKRVSCLFGEREVFNKLKLTGLPRQESMRWKMGLRITADTTYTGTYVHMHPHKYAETYIHIHGQSTHKHSLSHTHTHTRKKKTRKRN